MMRAEPFPRLWFSGGILIPDVFLNFLQFSSSMPIFLSCCFFFANCAIFFLQFAAIFELVVPPCGQAVAPAAAGRGVVGGRRQQEVHPVPPGPRRRRLPGRAAPQRTSGGGCADLPAVGWFAARLNCGAAQPQQHPFGGGGCWEALASLRKLSGFPLLPTVGWANVPENVLFPLRLQTCPLGSCFQFFFA